MVSSRCKKNLPSLQVDDDDLIQDDECVPSNKKKKAEDAIFQTGIPKSVTYLVIEGSTVNTTENTELDDSREAQDHDDDEDADNWEHPEDTEEFWSTNDTEDTPENMSQTSWEEISEVSSVHSFHSKTGMTFLDVARLATQQKVAADANTNKQQEMMDNWVAIAKARKQEKEEAVANEQDELPKNADSLSLEEMGEQFDADFMLHGTKGLRGGKEKFMFNRQPKKKYRQWRSKNQLDAMVSCGRGVPAQNMISDRQGNRIMVKA